MEKLEKNVALFLECNQNKKQIWEKIKHNQYPKITKHIVDFIKKHQEQNIQILTFDEFPLALKNIPNPPFLLFVKGKIESLYKPCISIVGARQSSLCAKNWTEDVTKALSKHYVICSGLAKGIDGVAHQFAGETIGVVAGGIDYIYPKENKILYARIPEYGCIISTEPLGVFAKASFFPKRNRIIAALGQAVIVVEASSSSGSMLTARYALEYDKTLFVVPGPPWDPRYSGSLKLLINGAIIAIHAKDILDVLNPLISFQTDTKETKLQEARLSLSQEELLSLLDYTPLSVYDLIKKYDSQQVTQIISELEIEGSIYKKENYIYKI